VQLNPERRWSVWIDVEGFSDLFQHDQTQALIALGHLMESIYRVGSTIYSRDPDRLFAHQFGDGFVIVSNFPEESAERPVSLAISLLRHLIAQGIACKAAVSCGGFADIGGCYPDYVLRKSRDRHLIDLGDGLMTINPVMGTALIASHKLASRHRGAVLVLDDQCFQTSELGIIRRHSPIIDWIHSELPLVRRISEEASLTYLDPESAEKSLRGYIQTQGTSLDEEWVGRTMETNGL